MTNDEREALTKIIRENSTLLPSGAMRVATAIEAAGFSRRATADADGCEAPLPAWFVGALSTYGYVITRIWPLPAPPSDGGGKGKP